jgi:chromosome partitioning protein
MPVRAKRICTTAGNGLFFVAIDRIPVNLDRPYAPTAVLRPCSFFTRRLCLASTFLQFFYVAPATLLCLYRGIYVIVAIVSEKTGTETPLLAVNLAVQRAQTRRSVLLIDTTPRQSSLMWSNKRHAAGIKPGIPALAITDKGLQPELDNLISHYKDIVIDAAGCDSHASKSALVAARLIIIPIQPPATDLAYQQKLIERINTARLFNPRLRVLVVLACADNKPPIADLNIVKAFIVQMPSAHLASTMIRSLASGKKLVNDGLSFREHGQDKNAMADLSALYNEVFAD